MYYTANVQATKWAGLAFMAAGHKVDRTAEVAKYKWGMHRLERSGAISLAYNYLSYPDLWNVYGECENFAVLKGHTSAIMELHYSTDGR